MKKRGGRRPGAGRKKGSVSIQTVLREDARAYVEKYVLAHLEPLLDTKLDLALGGYWYEDTDPLTGKPRKIYRKKPDNNAIDGLLAYAVGKPKEVSEVNVNLTKVNEIGDNLRALLSQKLNHDNDSNPTNSLQPLQGR